MKIAIGALGSSESRIRYCTACVSSSPVREYGSIMQSTDLWRFMVQTWERHRVNAGQEGVKV